MSYLDDSNHVWELEPVVLERPTPLDGLIEDLCNRQLEISILEIILQGYAGLKQRHPDWDDAACLDTSMVWMFG